MKTLFPGDFFPGKSLKLPIFFKSVKEILTYIKSVYIDKRGKIFIIIDSTVFTLYEKQNPLFFKEENCLIYTVRSGESLKSLTEVENIISFMIENNIDRNNLCLAFGGGVVSDFAGFVSSVYKRGISFSIVPTTLISMIDACYGGKTGINQGLQKNMIGTFWFPEKILICSEFLKTLPYSEIRSGLGEVAKYCIIARGKNDFLFEFSEQIHKINSPDRPAVNGEWQDEIRKNADIVIINKMIKQLLIRKKSIVSRDLFDNTKRMQLNLGHSLAHSLELLFGVPHGIGVAIGICYELFLSRRINGLNLAKYQGFIDFIINLIIKDYVSVVSCPVEKLLFLTENDKKMEKSMLRLFLLNSKGKPILNKLLLEQYFSVWTEFSEYIASFEF